jgi:hypothetical protein
VTHKPNPEVYRLAAEYIQNQGTKYTCIAIGWAASELNLSKYTSLYRAQYEACFGPYISVDSVKKDHWGDSYVEGVRKYDYSRTHPFWNAPFSHTRKKYRIMALLLMAEMCENPNN